MKFKTPIYIVAARRSPLGRFGGGLQGVGAVELATQVACATLQAVFPAEPRMDSVVFGQVLQAGVGMNLARQVALRVGGGPETPGHTVNMVCGSGLKAVGQAAAEIELGEAKVVLTGGVESMSNAPFYASKQRWGNKLGDVTLQDSILVDGLSDPLLNIEMGETAERIADAFGISRQEQDEYALRSQRLAGAAAEAFQREIVSIRTPYGVVERDEHPRPQTTIEKLAQLKPAFREHGTVTAGNSSGINDGAAAVVLAGKAAMDSYGWQPRARVVAACTTGCDPAMMGLGPVGAIRALIAQTGWDLEKVDAIEINEAFAAQALACQRELRIREDQLNQRGGAIALGHPIGCSGARLVVSLLHLLEDNQAQRGIAALCVGGGMGIAMAIERV